MLTSTCPSCAAPIRFKHAASLSTRCASCGNAVVRSGQDVEAIGVVSHFARDLSPLQVGATGRVGERPFEVAGVLRKAREHVRWNEWFLVFGDGGVGWLGEGNGQWQLFDKPPARVRAPSPLPAAGDTVELDGRKWQVVERAQARIAAAEGELPFAVTDRSAAMYLDLRSADGRDSATLDLIDGEPTLWVGRVVSLTALDLRGLRPIAGWSDPTLTDLAGPEISQVRTLRCPNCGGGLTLRAPGQSQSMACEYCGSELGLVDAGDATEARALSEKAARLWKPAIPLGSRGSLEGTTYEVIGAMERAVSFEGQDFPWTEHLLYNPYRGFAWLVESDGHFSLIRPIPDPPSGVGRDQTPDVVRHRGRPYRHFQGGRAKVRQVLGEFTWEVHRGDQASTDDWVAPPFMISRERSPGEVAWSLGVYLDAEEACAAFEVDPLPRQGIAPHQPNPYEGPAASRQVALNVSVFTALAALIAALGHLVADDAVLVDARVQTAPFATEEQVFVTDPFVVDDEGWRNLAVQVDGDIPDGESWVHVLLVNSSDGQSYATTRWGEAAFEQRLGRVSPGSYVGRIEVLKMHSAGKPAREVRVQVVRDPPYVRPALWVFLYGLAAVVLMFMARGNFEQRRWSVSDHA